MLKADTKVQRLTGGTQGAGSGQAFKVPELKTAEFRLGNKRTTICPSGNKILLNGRSGSSAPSGNGNEKNTLYICLKRLLLVL